MLCLETGYVRRALAGALLSLSLLISACGGGGKSELGAGGGGTTTPPPSGSSCDSTSCGTAYVGIMDADGDFDSYSVDVVSLSLKKANGSAVETLPAQPRIDFTDLVDLKEFVTAATIPNGTYVAGTMRLDFTNADIVVDVGGVPTHAVAVDANGAPLTTVDLDIQLDNRHQLTITPGKPALLELDFDLAASNTVDLTKTPVQVMVKPFIVASVDVADSREARVRGPLVSVDSAAGDYKIDLRPFNLASARLGQVTVHTTSTTEFEIDGTTYTGSPGVTALAALAAGAPTAAYGTLNVDQRTFAAERVHAGSSVASAQFDVMDGNVIARNGDQLTVRGVTLVKRTGGPSFIRNDTTLTVGANTKVTKDGEMNNALTKDALSIGQRVHAFGTATDLAGGGVTFDATSGRVRMQLTHVLGTVKSAGSGALALDVTSIDGHVPTIFSFVGTSPALAADADPHNYEVSTGNLDLSRLDTGKAARAFGFVTPFGAAPPDFTARTLVDFRDVPALLSLGWGPPGTATPFLTVDASGLVIDNHNSSIGLRHVIAVGPALTDIKSLASGPRIVPDATKSVTFAIADGRRIDVFTMFGDFTAAVAQKLAGGSKAVNLAATGDFNAATGDFTARRVLLEVRSTN
ncbi:MAG: DUF4382 domain-containing protein [Gammaproteobacteria bacterium]